MILKKYLIKFFQKKEIKESPENISPPSTEESQVDQESLEKDSKKQIGFIAQDVEEIIPELVNTDNSGDQYKSIAYGNVTALLVEAIKELRKEVKDLKDEIRELKSI